VSSRAAELPVEGYLPSFDGATGWLNSPPLSRADLRGKIVVVDFCTYTCINWIRTLPYVRAWADKYTAHGLVVIGAHTPEFSVEKDVEDVRRALSEMRVLFPVALDSDYAIWDAFSNRYWPALYFADGEGKIRHHRFGEGDYERSEEVIQALLAETGKDVGGELVTVDPRGPEVAADWDDLRSAETYVGYRRTENFGSPGGIIPQQPNTYALPERLAFNGWALAGGWTMGVESVVSTASAASIAFRFHARDLHLVMGPGAGGAGSPFSVSLDGEAPGDAAGTDVAPDGAGKLDQPRMYQLIRQRGPIGSRLFEIEFQEPAAQAFVFTFG
jgi:thiol-disulfide isomerase/thioredoxin